MTSRSVQNDALQQEYDVTLQQYQEAVQNYIALLNQQSTTAAAPKFVSFSGRTWWGTKGLKEQSVSSQQECENMCLENTQCSGATFNPVKRYCWTRAGDASMTVGTSDDVALLTEERAALVTMQRLNNELLRINEVIVRDVQGTSVGEQKPLLIKLTATRDELLSQKAEIEKQQREHATLSAEVTNQQLFAEQQDMHFTFWLLVVLVLVCSLFGQTLIGLGLALLFIVFLRSTVLGWCFAAIIALIAILWSQI